MFLAGNAQKCRLAAFHLPRGGSKSKRRNYMVNIVILKKTKILKKEKKKNKNLKKNEKFWKKIVYVYNIEVLYM